MNVSERSSHPSSAQIEAMIDFLERNPDLAKGFSKTLNARERSRRHWEVLSERLNSMGGTIKTYKQWTKYWSDKKSAVKKKVAAQAAARRRTGGGVEDVAELSALEERIVALYGGPEFGTGDAHLGIQLFSQSDSTQLVPPASSLIQSSGHSEVSNVPQLENLQEVIQPDVVLAPETPEETHRRSKIVRRLFESSDIFPSEPSQSSLQLYHSEPRPSTPALTLSHTPTPLSISIASPSRRGATAAISSRITSTIESAGSSSSRRVQPPSPQQSHAVTTEASPSRRGATGSGTGPSRSVPSRRRAESCFNLFFSIS
ncbi:uncharacterized protein LOC126367356 isoform X1 [Pectinophora gossypiella]|uniref:uncharacterized protein LOC126367356 isoform X1 n=1 Tax=Pectinophora gossypiella TaxID=13191 RepID=UPI00214F1787|nr:uncharacterized protein LOC126367356 isoform X1 [Pectinophora gossypiella]